MKICGNEAVTGTSMAISLRGGGFGRGSSGRMKVLRNHAVRARRKELQKVCSFTLEARCEAVSAGKGQEKICPYTLEKVGVPALLHCLTAQ